MWTLPPVCDTLSEAGNELGAMAVRGVIVAILSAPRHLLRRGVTLIEAVLFIAVALTLIVGGLVFYQQAQVARQTQETVRLVRSLVAESRAIYRAAPPTGQTDLVPVLIASGAVPARYIDTTSNRIVSPWGGDISIWGGPLTTPLISGESFTRNSLRIDLDQVPSAVCARIASFDDQGNGILGSRLIDGHSQKITVAASAMADRNTFGQRS
jgi:type II secretory pathway pseudopilin PulG